MPAIFDQTVQLDILISRSKFAGVEQKPGNYLYEAAENRRTGRVVQSHDEQTVEISRFIENNIDIPIFRWKSLVNMFI